MTAGAADLPDFACPCGCGRVYRLRRAETAGVRQFAESAPGLGGGAFDPAKHPHKPAGSREGGQFAPKAGGGGGTSAATAEATPAEPKPGGKKFGKSKAPVEVTYKVAGKAHPAIQSVIDRFGGGQADNISSLVGAPDDAKVSLWVTDEKRGKVEVRISHKDFDAKRELGVDADGKKYIENKEFWVKPGAQGKGVGTEVFGRQVENAREAGIDYIKCHAARENPAEPSKPHNGYYTWPRFGYDQPIAAIEGHNYDLAGEIYQKFPHANTVLDVMAAPGGRDYWKRRGDDLHGAKFDLSPGSRSLQVFDAYLRERETRGQLRSFAEAELATRGAAGGRHVEGIDLTPEDEAALDRVWSGIETDGFRPPPPAPGTPGQVSFPHTCPNCGDTHTVTARRVRKAANTEATVGARAPGATPDDVTTPQEMGEIADILAHVYGPGPALALFDEPSGAVRQFWDEQQHPRGPNGRFIRKGTAEAYGAARQSVADALRKPKTADSHRELVGHLATLNVQQLHALKKEYGISAGAPNKAELVAKLADRLNRGRREGGAAPRTNPAAPAPGQPVLPGRPIAERLAAYTEGDAIVKRLAAHGEELDRATEAYRSAAAIHAENGKALMAAQKRYNELGSGAKRKDMDAAGKSLRDATAKYRQSLAAGRQASAALESVKEKARAAVTAELKAAQPAELAGTVGFTGPTRTAVNEGRRWLGTVTQAPKGAAGIGVDFEPNRRADGGAHSDRAHCTADGTKVRLDGHEDAGTVVHELGHAIEERIPGIKQAAQEFLAHRVGDEPLTPMREKFGAGYQDHEMGRKDRFDRYFPERKAYYTGKSYRSKADGRLYATEITSMGVEALYRDPAGFAKADAEYCKLIVGVLSGALR